LRMQGRKHLALHIAGLKWAQKAGGLPCVGAMNSTEATSVSTHETLTGKPCRGSRRRGSGSRVYGPMPKPVRQCRLLWPSDG
jgi:hypothetical protein